MTNFTELLKGNLTEYIIEYRVHATRRMFQRHIGAEDVTFLLTHGQVIERYDEDFPLSWGSRAPLAPNAALQAPPIAAARYERRLLAVACTPWLGAADRPRMTHSYAIRASRLPPDSATRVATG